MSANIEGSLIREVIKQAFLDSALEALLQNCSEPVGPSLTSLRVLGRPLGMILEGQSSFRKSASNHGSKIG